jgi:hypothetical protein
MKKQQGIKKINSKIFNYPGEVYIKIKGQDRNPARFLIQYPMKNLSNRQ